MSKKLTSKAMEIHCVLIWPAEESLWVRGVWRDVAQEILEAIAVPGVKQRPRKIYLFAQVVVLL